MSLNYSLKVMKKYTRVFVMVGIWIYVAPAIYAAEILGFTELNSVQLEVVLSVAQNGCEHVTRLIV